MSIPGPNYIESRNNTSPRKTYLSAYCDTYSILLEHYLKNKNHGYYDLYPLTYILFHITELIVKYAQYSLKKNSKLSHQIQKIWETVKNELPKYKFCIHEEEIELIDQLVKKFSKIESSHTLFKYSSSRINSIEKIALIDPIKADLLISKTNITKIKELCNKFELIYEFITDTNQYILNIKNYNNLSRKSPEELTKIPELDAVILKQYYKKELPEGKLHPNYISTEKLFKIYNTLKNYNITSPKNFYSKENLFNDLKKFPNLSFLQRTLSKLSSSEIKDICDLYHLGIGNITLVNYIKIKNEAHSQTFMIQERIENLEYLESKSHLKEKIYETLKFFILI